MQGISLCHILHRHTFHCVYVCVSADANAGSLKLSIVWLRARSFWHWMLVMQSLPVAFATRLNEACGMAYFGAHKSLTQLPATAAVATRDWPNWGQRRGRSLGDRD